MLIINDTEHSDQNRITNGIYSFYGKLYSSNFSPNSAQLFFDKIINFSPQISEDFRNICDVEITYQDLGKAVQSLTPERSHCKLLLTFLGRHQNTTCV